MEKDMKEKQKSVERDAFTPTGDSHLRRSVTLSLNREETLSDQIIRPPFLTTTMWTHSPTGLDWT
jgi:hypothetical protein